MSKDMASSVTKDKASAEAKAPAAPATEELELLKSLPPRPPTEELELLKSLPPRPPRLTRQRGFYEMETSRRPFDSRFINGDYNGNPQMQPSGGI